MPYPTIDDLLALSEADELAASSAAQKTLYRRLAIKAVEGYTGQHFESEERPVENPLVIDGPGGGELYLPRRLERLDTITVKGSDIDLTDVELSEKGDRLTFAPYATGYAIDAMRETSYDVRTFRRGAGTVAITGLLGWSEVPEDVTAAIVLEMEELAKADSSAFADTVAAFRRLGLRQAMQGNVNMTIGDPSSISPRAAALLGDYLWLGPAGVLL